MVLILLRSLNNFFPGESNLQPRCRFMTLTKATLADHLFQQLGLNVREAKDLVDAVFEELKKALESGEQVKLSGFGNFELLEKKERPGRNPKTGEEVAIAARRVVTFSASPKLKKRMEGYGGGV
ncbi:integration host factor subunit alpha [Gammaproteobacteria bacterium]